MNDVPMVPPPPSPQPFFPPLPASCPRTEDKIWSILSHVSILIGFGIILPLVIFLVKKDESPEVRHHAAQALNFHICVILYTILCIPMVLVVIGIPLLILIGFGALVLTIVAAIRASEGRAYQYPLTIQFVR